MWACLAGAALGCGSAETSAPVPAPPSAASQPAASSEAREPGPPGAVRVDFDGANVSLEANDALSSQVLLELSAKTGMQLDVGEAGIRDRRITARIESASLFDVLSLVLRGVPFRLEVGFDPVAQRHRVEVLRIVGESAGDAEYGHSPLEGALFQLLDNEDPQVVLAALDALGRADDPEAAPMAAEEIEPLLEDEDPVVREAAAAALDALEADSPAGP